MRSLLSMLLIGTAAFALAACTAGEVASGGTAAVASNEPAPAAGGVVRRGDSFAMMSEQYSPREGPFAATGASAWVRPSPPPAFVAAGPPPPADPPAPPPAAVANRQPGAPAANAPSAPPASDSARPEAAAPDAPTAAAPSPALRTAGLALFNDYSCGTCHILADANASGSIGPSLDRNALLSKEFAVDVIGTGRGAMPSFAGQLSDAQIATLADYLVAFSRK